MCPPSHRSQVVEQDSTQALYHSCPLPINQPPLSAPPPLWFPSERAHLPNCPALSLGLLRLSSQHVHYPGECDRLKFGLQISVSGLLSTLKRLCTTDSFRLCVLCLSLFTILEMKSEEIKNICLPTLKK